MKPTLFLAGALALALVPGALLLPGCGGGSGSGGAALPELRFGREANVEFPDAPGVSGILTVGFADQTPGTNARAAGTLQLFRTPDDQPLPEPFPESGDGSADDFILVVPANATYIVVGNVNYSRDRETDLTVDLRGSYEDSPRFTLRGDFVENGTISLDAPFRLGNSRLRGRLTNINRVVRPNVIPTPTVTAGNTTAGNTTAATTAGTTAANTTAATTAGATAGNTTAATTAATTAGTTAATTAGTTAGNTTAATTAGATTGNTTAGTTAGNTTAGSTTAGSATAGATTAGAGTAGSTTAGATTAGSTLGGGGTTNPPQTP